MVAIVAAGIALAAAPAASADPDCADRGVRDSKLSIQLWTFAEYIGFGTDPATIARTEKYRALLEHDPRFGDPTFDPFEAAQKGFDYLDCVTY